MTLRIHGRRTLKSPTGMAIRPTSSRIRQSIFGILQRSVEGSRWLDLCCGAGTMGAEALSRGAASVVGVDCSRVACELIRVNWAKLGTSKGAARVIQADALKVLRAGFQGDTFDVIYLDPPYDSPIYAEALPLLSRLLTSNGDLFVEHSINVVLADTIAGLSLQSRRKMGQANLSHYRRAVTNNPC